MKKYIIGTDECPVQSDESQLFWLFQKTLSGYGPHHMVEVYNDGEVYYNGTIKLFDWTKKSDYNLDNLGCICIGPIEAPNPDEY